MRVTPSPLRLPRQPELPLEPELAVFLLALPLALGGETRLAGVWPQWPGAMAGWELLQALGLDLRRAGADIHATAATPLKNFRLKTLPEHVLAEFPTDWTPLPVALAACAALRGGESLLPPLPVAADRDEVASFLHAAGLEADVEGRLCKTAQESLATAWNAPTPAWALGLALAACAKPHLKLGNPGIMTGLYPAFWSLYNGLPEPSVRRTAAEETATAPARRRIITKAVAVPPELKDEID